MSRLAAALAAAMTIATPAFAADPTPLIVGHRGAPGYYPDHTLGSYAAAIDMGADYIEPDLVMTKDGVLIARHENLISGTTDADQKFPQLKKTKVIDGTTFEGVFAEDLTLAEIKTLRARQPLAWRSKAFDGVYEVPTLQEVIDLAKRRSVETGRTIGIYPETKHPTYHASLGFKMEETLVTVLHQNGYLGREAPVFIQSFEVGNLKKMAGMTQIRLIQLFDDAPVKPGDVLAANGAMTYADMMKPEQLAEIAKYAYGIGPWKRLIIGENADKTLKAPGTLIADAHKAGLKVHAYTFRSEERYLAKDYNNDPIKEYLQFFAMGLDGLFTDQPEAAVAARRQFQQR